MIFFFPLLTLLVVGICWFYFLGVGKHLSFFSILHFNLALFSFSLSVFISGTEEVLNDCKKLSLTDIEGSKISLTKSKKPNSKEYVLAVKFLMRRALNVEVIGKTFKPLQRSWNEFKVKEVGDHVLLFVFELETIAKRVLATKPWSFDKHVVLFQRYDTSVPARYLRFTKMKLWVQIHGLPMEMLDPKTTIKLGEALGTVSPIEHSKEIMGHYKKTGLSQRFQNRWDSPKKRWDRVKIPIPVFFSPALQTAGQ